MSKQGKRFSIDDAFAEEGDDGDDDEESESPGKEPEPPPACWRHPKVREKWKTVAAAVALVLIGVALASVGAAGAAGDGLKAAVFAAAGLICFVPGAYHVVYVCLAARGRRGYHFHRLPLFT